MTLEVRPLNERDWPLVVEKLGIKWVEDTCGMVAEERGQTLGLVVYDNWGVTGVHMHNLLIEPYIITQGWVHTALRFPFSRPEIQNIWGLVPENIPKAIRFNEQVGFEHVRHIPDYIKPGVGYMVMVMRRENCKFLEEEDENGRRGQEERAGTG